MIRKYTISVLFTLFVGFFVTISLPACSKKVGCPATENATTKTDKHGNYKVKKPSSGLLPPKGKKK